MMTIILAMITYSGFFQLLFSSMMILFSLLQLVLFLLHFTALHL